MNSTTQSGMHPDANTLSAFAEQLLPTAEREQVLAHMAGCNRCREVVFLAQQAAADEPVTRSALATTRDEKTHTWWLRGWRWAWLPAGAFAALIGIVIVLHSRRTGPEAQMARNTISSEAVRPATPTPPVAAAQFAPAPTVSEKPHEMRKSQPPKAKDSLEREENKVEPQKQVALGAVAPPILSGPGLAGGAVHGAMRARAPSSSYGGPMANQVQQNAMPQQQGLNQQNAIQNQRLFEPAQNSNAKPADKGAVAGLTPASASETVTINAAPVMDEKRDLPAPAPSAQLSDAAAGARDFEFSHATAQLKKAAKTALPGGAQALSVASAAGRTIAIDTSGALFLSEDRGGHWQPVMTQWTGKAVLVRNMPGQDRTGLLQTPPLRFELINDKLQAWTSIDGKTWTAKPVPDK